jgi:hypothetical protein
MNCFLRMRRRMSVSRPSVYVLRKPSDPFPEDDKVVPGDFVIMHSGDVNVWDGVFWHLLPGRFISVDELKEFLGYVGSGWPTSQEDARSDLTDKLPELFLERMLKVCARLQKVKESGD